MIVFKCYMKILRQNVTLVIIYLGIFFSVALVMQMAAGKSEDSLYANTSIDIGVVKEDQGVLAQGFVDYLNTIHNVIPMKNNPEVLQENLFYRNVEYIVQIPADFYEACIQGRSPRFQDPTAPIMLTSRSAVISVPSRLMLLPVFPRRKPFRQ